MEQLRLDLRGRNSKGKILVMGIEDASSYVPDNPTYAIRIFLRKKPEALDTLFQLQSPLYKTIHEYRFNDSFFEGEPTGCLQPEQAREIITDFRNGYRKCIDLLVHCLRGRNRSPAVAMALNDIFQLGEDTNKMKELFPRWNDWVYQLMIHEAKSLKIT